MASTQIEIALADDDRKRIDRLCRMMEVTVGTTNDLFTTV
jgi:hypothetical protein